MKTPENKKLKKLSGLITIIAVLVVMIINQSNTFQSQKITIGIIVTEVIENDPEIQAAFTFLENSDLYQPQKIYLSKIINNPKFLNDFDIIWFHYADSVGIPNDFKAPQVINIINNYIESGGNLLLTQEAFTYLHTLGLEKYAAQLDYANAVDHGYGRKLGFHAFIDHPLFKNLHGGAYVFNPYEDQKTRLRGYFDNEEKINGKVIGVEWAYITFHENKKLILEYEKGEGKVLAIGAYTLFNINNNNTDQFNQFMNNTFSYLTGAETQRELYWKQDIGNVEKFNPTEDIMEYPDPVNWDRLPSNLSFKFENKSNEFWDLTGERMMVMGREKSGIDEIWVHPTMAIKDYRAGIKLSDDEVVWLSEINPTIKITPSSFIREYELKGIKLTELISAHHEEPKTVIHYEFEGGVDAEILIGFNSNLRLMWPYSSIVMGEINYAWSDDLNAFFIKDDVGDFISLVGMNRAPEQQIIGRYDSVFYENGDFIASETDKFQCGALAVFKANKPLDIVVAASHFADPYAVDYLKEGLTDPFSIYKNSNDYYSDLLNDKLMITTPDKDLNTGYRWALIGTDRHFVVTPGIGKSLVAGIGNTTKGWDGGHKVNGRPGYAWYFGRDSEWSGFAITAYGDFGKVKDILQMLIDYQKPNGKIFHELTTSGAVHYDAADATPLFIILAGKYLQTSGDKEFIKKNWDAITQAMNYCYSSDTDNDLLINNTNTGHGWVEGGFLFGGKTTLYLASCWAEALEEASYMANILGLADESKKYKENASKVTALVQKLFWNEETSYYNHSINWDSSFIEEKTIMPAIPMYFNQLQDEKVQNILKDFASNNFTANWGCRIVGEDNKQFNPSGYHVGSVWPLFTGWVTLAEYKYGNHSQAYSHLMNNINVYKYWAKGFVEEVLHGAEYTPSGYCAHQCWSETMAIQPLIEGMLGLEVDANLCTLKLSPAIPANWDHYKIENIKIGDNILHYEMQRQGDDIVYTFNYSGDDELKIYLNPTYLNGATIQEIIFNNNPILLKDSILDNYPIELSIKENSKLTITYDGGISVIPLVQNPKPGDKASGTRIISTELKGNVYEIILEAPVNTVSNFEVYSTYPIIRTENTSVISNSDNIYKLEVHFNDSGEKYIKTKVSLIIDK